MEFIFLFLATIIVAALAIRILAWFIKFIYNVSPAILLWVIVIAAIFYYENKPDINTKDMNAGITKSIKD